MVDVQAGRPVPVTLLDDGAVDGEFDTLVGGGAHVGHHAAYTRGARQGKAEEDVLRSDRVVLGRTAETALEEGEVHTEVPGLGVFPAEFRVRQGGHIVTRGVVVVAVVVDLSAEGAEGLVRADGLVGGLTVTEAELELVEPAAGTLHEALLVEVPTHGNGGIGVPLMALGQAGGGVGTDSHRQHVAVVVGIHETAHVGEEAGLGAAPVVRADRQVLLRIAEVVVLEVLVGDVVAGDGLGGVDIVVRLHQAGDVHTVLAGEDAVKGQEVLDVPADGLAVRPGSAVQRGGRVGGDAAAGEGTRLAVAIVQTEIDLIGEAFNPGLGELHITCVVGREGLALADILAGGRPLFDTAARGDILVVHRHLYDGA